MNNIQRPLMTLGVAALLLLLAGVSHAALQQPLRGTKDPVDFNADAITYDEQTQRVTANGEVEIAQAGRILKADQVDYWLAEDKVYASGNVALTDEKGNVYFADKFELTDDMKNGAIAGFHARLSDGSRFWAASGNRKDGTVTTMEQATYTPCDPCTIDPSKPPVWQINADSIEYDQKEAKVVYRDATFEVLGVPIAYTPYFSHPDGTIKQKSGFLTPGFGGSSDGGLNVSSAYYWAIDPSQDLTLGITAFTKQAPMVTGEWRREFDNAEIELSAGITHSDRIVRQSNGLRTRTEEETRGHLFGHGLWDIDSKWRAGLDLELASDDQYLRQYDFSGKDVLENEIYLERFSGRNYTAIRALNFQDIRISDRQREQPDVLPEFEASFMGDPGETLGGRWEADVLSLLLRRGGDGQDLMRFSGDLGWKGDHISDLGTVSTLMVDVQSDIYRTEDRDQKLLNPADDNSRTDTRIFPSVHLVNSYPMARNFDNYQAVIAPKVAVTAAPRKGRQSGLPNEDSQDAELDAMNLFEANRFKGRDRVEDGSRVTYGVQSGIYSHGGSQTEMFVGQSYRFSEHATPFNEGSGLNEQQSDYVAQISTNIKDRFYVDYSTQIGNDDFKSVRHELDADLFVGRFDLGTRYFFSRGLEGTDLDESRQQIEGTVVYHINDELRMRSLTTHDVGGENTGLRRAAVGLDYFGQCFNVSTTVRRNLTREETGESSTEFLVGIGLKNLGEFSTGDQELKDFADYRRLQRAAFTR